MSITIPKAIWQSAPDSRITCIISTKEGNRVIAGMSNGTICIFKRDPQTREQLIPDVYCIGPASTIVSLLSYQIELEDSDSSDNAIVSITATGDICLWHIYDGQCLQTRHERNDGVKGILQGVQIHSCGALVCYGECNNLVILDGATLELHLIWLELGLFPSAYSPQVCEKDVDRMLLLDADGNIHSMLLDLRKFTCIKDPLVQSCHVISQSIGNAIDISVNPHDKHIFFVLEKTFCEVLHAEFKSLIKIASETSDTFFKGAKFLSARTLLIWNDHGASFLYYLGDSTDLQQGTCGNLEPRSIVLISDGQNAIYVKNLDVGYYSSYKSATCIGVSEQSDRSVSLLPCPATLLDSQQTLYYFSCDTLQKMKIAITPFWANITGSKMNEVQISNKSRDAKMMVYLPISAKYQMRDLWTIESPKHIFTSMVALQKSFVAMGFENGDIAIIPQTEILMKHQDYWYEAAILVFKGHTCPVTCLFVPDFPNSNLQNLLLSGDKFGNVILWNTVSGKKLSTFYDHSQRICRFAQLPPEVGGKYKTGVISIGQDNSVNFVPILAVAQIKVKRLVDEMYNGEHLTPPLGRKTGGDSPPDTPTIDRTKPKGQTVKPIQSVAANTKVAGNSATGKINQSIDLLKKSFPIPGTINTSKAVKQPVDDNSPSTELDKEKRGSRPDDVLVSDLFSCIMSWGMDANLDRFCVEKLKLTKPANACIGLRGAGGYLSFPIPHASKQSTADWTYSANLTAQRLLTIVALVRSLVSNYNLNEDPASLMRKFGTMMNENTISDFKPPSFSILIKFWQDSIPDIQEAAKFLLSRSLTTLTEEQLNKILAYWGQFLPLQVPVKSKTGCRAAVVLGLVGSLLPNSLPLRLCKDVSTSLEAIIKDPLKNAYRLLAIEILGNGFPAWEPHLNGSGVIRCLVHLTGLSGQQSVNGGPMLNPANMMMARQALLAIAGCNPALFVSTLTFDLLHAKDVWDRVGCLKLLGLFISKKPLMLYNHLLPMIDSMVKMLDPNHPSLRESLQDIVTVNFAELVKVFPSVAFHSGSQRLAIATLDGNSVIYDLRTATKVTILEGHRAAVHGISFSPNGKLLASLSLQENQIAFWQPAQGFLGSLVGAFSGGTTGARGGISVPSMGVGRLSPFRTFAIGQPNTEVVLEEAIRDIKFEWTGERALRLFSIRGLELVFNV
ncbi:hypothetical protein HDV02_004091 [Globomyces sp. JEL0801]|nr:hypothetical protein HDV02_004091 [Globomyces sp. JEL0801]